MNGSELSGSGRNLSNPIGFADPSLGTTASLLLGNGDNEGDLELTTATQSGEVATVTIGFDSNGAFSTTGHCGVWGTGITSG
jgi:hypothetical protein